MRENRAARRLAACLDCLARSDRLVLAHHRAFAAAIDEDFSRSLTRRDRADGGAGARWDPPRAAPSEGLDEAEEAPHCADLPAGQRQGAPPAARPRDRRGRSFRVILLAGPSRPGCKLSANYASDWLVLYGNVHLRVGGRDSTYLGSAVGNGGRPWRCPLSARVSAAQEVERPDGVAMYFVSGRKIDDAPVLSGGGMVRSAVISAD